MSPLDTSISVTSASRLACLSLLGPDAMTFLQGQLTCDMRPLVWQNGKGGVSLAARLNLKGRVMASLWVLGVPEGFLLVLPEAQADSLLADLKKYVLFSKAKLAREAWSVSIESADAGLASGEVIKRGADVWACLSHVDAHVRITPSTTTMTQQNAFELTAIQAGVALVLPQTAGLWLPQELVYDHLGAVSYSKGCYLGQEIVARLHFKGEVKQRLYQVELQADVAQPVPAPADVLQDTQGGTLGQWVNVQGATGTSAVAQRLTGLAVLRTALAGDLLIAAMRWRVTGCQTVVKS